MRQGECAKDWSLGGGRRVGCRLASAALESLEPVVADVRQPLDSHHSASVSGTPARQAGDQGIAAVEAREQLSSMDGDGGILGIHDDGSKGSVDVAHHCRSLRVTAQRSEKPIVAAHFHRPGAGQLVCPSMFSHRAARLAAIGTAAGAFSALLGVGGGTVIVPLLVLWLGYGEHEATGTSLAAIAVIAALAAGAQGAYGNVDIGKGLLLGAPGVVGVALGTSFQQRLSGRAISLLFGLLLVVVALVLLIP